MRFLIAGATGQLGHGVIEASLDRSDELIPLVRAHGRLTAAARFARLFGGHQELAASVVEGDVTQPLWGLEPERLEEIADGLDGVINVAAETNWALSTRRLSFVNTLAAVRGYELARALSDVAGRRISYCWASSVHAAGGLTGSIAEAPFPPDAHRTPYEQSKWLGEQALLDRSRDDDGPPVAIARVGGLLGNSQTGATARRHSLYLLADRWSRLPAHLFPVAPGGRIDMLPRDDAGDLLLRFAAAAIRLGDPDPLIAHVCAGEGAPTTASLLATMRSLDIRGRVSQPRPVPVPARALLWASENLDRLHELPADWRNVVIGARYLAFDRIFERARLARLVGRRLPAPSVEQIARMAFDLPRADRPQPLALERPLARFAG